MLIQNNYNIERITSIAHNIILLFLTLLLTWKKRRKIRLNQIAGLQIILRKKKEENIYKHALPLGNYGSN